MAMTEAQSKFDSKSLHMLGLSLAERNCWHLVECVIEEIRARGLLMQPIFAQSLSTFFPQTDVPASSLKDDRHEADSQAESELSKVLARIKEGLNAVCKVTPTTT